MKKHYFLGLLALGLMTSCQEEEIFEKGQFVNSDVVVRATLDESSTTRTQLTSNENNNGYKVLWAENDTLSIFSSNSAHAKFVLSKGAGEANADFKFESGDLNFATEDGSNDFGYVGVYPYSESTTISKNETGYVINTAIPTEQAYAVNSFGQDASPMVAVDPSLKLSFKNVGSILVLPLKGEGTITSATLKSKSKKIAGTATVTVTEEGGWIPTVDVTGGESEVVLTCGEGVTLNAENATNFFFVLAPGTYEANDLVITFNNAAGKYFETTITAENTFERSKSVKFSERTFAVTGTVDGVTTEDALRSAIDEGKTKVTLDANIDLTSPVEVSKDLVINLNNKSIKCASSDVFVVTAGTLTINGDGDVYGSYDNSSTSCAVWAKENGNVIINGGTYKVGHDEASKTAGSNNWRNDCIYARDNAKITINGGEFMYTGDIESEGHRFLLNCRDADYKAGTCSIIVKGGTFHKFNPGETSSENPVASYVAAGYSSVAGENETYVVSEGIFNEAALKAAIAANKAEVTLGANIDLTSPVEVSKDLVINLNNKSIKCASSDVFVVTAGTLTINGDGDVYGSYDNSSTSCAVWAKENGNVIINGGTYKVGHDEASKTAGSNNWRNDCIYARDNAKITINGGEFMYTGDIESEGHRFLLNCRDADYKAGTCSIIVKGGTFHKFNPGGTSSENPVASYVAAGYSSVAGENETYVVSKGIFNETALNAAIANGAEITLNADMTIEKAITIPTGIAATINLNGFDVTAPNTDAFEVAGTLIINGPGESVVSAGSKNPNASVCAVWANGGIVTINGGHYMAYSDAAGKRNDCIYAGYNADNNNTAGNITINGGIFEYVWPSIKTSGIDYNGDMFLLNCADKDLYQTVITVNGGQFKNNAPSFEATTPGSRSDKEVKLGAGKKVYNGETEVTAAHNATTDIWYVVK